MAANPPNSAQDKAEPGQRSALSAVFRRIASDPAPSEPEPPLPQLPEPPPRPAPLAPSGPQLLGFAEPVVHVPPVEDFLPPPETPPGAGAPRITALQPAPAGAAPLRARVRELPSGAPPPAAPPSGSVPPAAPPERPQNLLGRLGRRPSEAAAPPTVAAPQPVPAPVTRRAPAPAAPPPAAPPPVARRAPGAAPKPAAPAAAPERAGRPALPRNRRLYRRASVPADIEVAGEACTLIDLSIGGFAATGVPRGGPDATVPVTIRLVIDGIEVGTQLSARIIYVTQGRSGGRFVDLSPSQMAFLRYIVTWRGESVGAVGTTTLLDAISGGGVPPGGDRSDLAKSRWWTGLIGRRVEPPR